MRVNNRSKETVVYLRMVVVRKRAQEAQASWAICQQNVVG